MMKFAFKYFGYRFRQYRRKTNEKIVVETEYGPVKGVKRISCWNDPFYSFERIPFAKPPLGELRFRDPVHPEPWTQPIDCTKGAPSPLQMNFIVKVVHGTEDCLYLNVYTKDINPNKPKPVMVWIYGGGFENGGATKMLYGPDYFMQKDVILITMNYRVGALGFLSLKDPSLNIPGNAGLKDQIFGLQWVQKNIKNFGGDPDNVTVFGESAGSASVHYLMITEKTKGLFHKAILMSGTVLSPWAIMNDHDQTFRLAKKLGYRGEMNEAEILKFLLKVKGRRICIENGNLLSWEEKLKGQVFAHGPTIEPYISDQCVIPKDPKLMAREAWSNDIPVIMGGTSAEGLVFSPLLKWYPQMLDNLNDCSHLFPCENENKSEIQNTCLELKAHYFKDSKPTNREFLNLLGDKHFWHPILRTLRIRLKNSNAPTYMYRFDFDSPFFNSIRIALCGKNVRGASHGDDLLYLFYGVLTADLKAESKELKVIQQMIGMLTTFAAISNPNYDEIYPVNWKNAQKNEKVFKCLNISDELAVIDIPNSNILEKWDKFYTEETLL